MCGLCGKNCLRLKVSGRKRRTVSCFMPLTSRFSSLMPTPGGWRSDICILTELCRTTFCKRFLWMLCLPTSPFTKNTTPSSLLFVKNPAKSPVAVKFARVFGDRKCNTQVVLMENLKTASFALDVFRLEKCSTIFFALKRAKNMKFGKASCSVRSVS